ncbi:MAG: hypothetical protein HY736_26155 [Verrucomicrobia bacterium]|nr:hypothetical protein [Verrucomicrobiota bacterium]
MGTFTRLLCLALASAPVAAAAPPPALAKALEFLRDQKSYSWEVINADPGPVAQQLETRRGTITTVQQNLSPHLKGSIDLNGDTLIQREWSDGLRLDTVITADGGMITKTPEGWMTNQEILTAQAEERMGGGGPTPRFLWLRRADRPDVRRPDQELVPFLKSTGDFFVSGDSYVVQRRIRPEGSSKSAAEDAAPASEVAVTMNLRSGLIRDYEVKIEGTRAVTRARVQVPVSDQRIVILTYLPVSKIPLPDEAREKLRALASPGLRRKSTGR